MILDALLQVSDAQQVTADAYSTNTVDAGNVTPKRQIQVGESMGYLMAITAAGTNTGSTKLQAVQSANANLSSHVVVGQVDLAAAQIVAGNIYIIPIGSGMVGLRYHGMYHDITGTVDYTVDAFGPIPLSQCAALAATYAKGYTA